MRGVLHLIEQDLDAAPVDWVLFCRWLTVWTTGREYVPGSDRVYDAATGERIRLTAIRTQEN